MTGTQVLFDATERAERIRKTIAFDPFNDAFVLDYINCRVEAGESFSSVIKELLLQIITLIELAPTFCHNTPQTSHNTPQTEKNKGRIESPFDNLLT